MTLLDDQRALHGQLKAAQNRTCHDTLVIRDTTDHCRTLQEREAKLQHDCKQFNDALDKMRAQQAENHRSLTMERERRAAMELNWSTLYSENQTLWKLFTQGGIQSELVEQVIRGYQNQQEIICNLNAQIDKCETRVSEMGEPEMGEYQTGDLRSEWLTDEDSDEEGTVFMDKDSDEG